MKHCLMLFFALTTCAWSAPLDELVAQLGSTVPQERRAAEQQLRDNGLSAFPSLLKAITHSDLEIRRSACRLIVALDRPALPLLHDAKQESEASERRFIIEGLHAGISDLVLSRERETLRTRITAAVSSGRAADQSAIQLR